MRDPKLLLGFTEDDLLIMHRSDGSGGGKLPGWITFDLAKFESKGYLDFASRVGGMALRYLALAHPEQFAKHPLLVPPKDPDFDDPYCLVIELVSRSIKGRTTSFVPAIDQLFVTDAEELARCDAVEFWRTQRAVILEHYGPK